MTNLKPTSIDDLAFELRDTEIFKIPDTKTRIETVQNYFFPRLELLLVYTVDLIQEIYGVNPYEEMTFVYRPSNRKKARQNSDFNRVHIGLSGKRRLDRELKYKRDDGKTRFHHSAYLKFVIELDGSMRVDLSPFGLYVGTEFVCDVASLYKENFEALSLVFELLHISHDRSGDFVPLRDFFFGSMDEVIYSSLFSSTYYFPTNIDRGLWRLILCFVALYPLLDSLNRLDEGKLPRLSEMLASFKTWYVGIYADTGAEEISDEEKENKSSEHPNIPELESYSFIRAGLWWSVLARDNWTCCSCGRSSKEEGIILEVDHILPRSKGGSDDLSNLQTLCKKCNIGKSNRDDTDLRRGSFDSPTAST